VSDPIDIKALDEYLKGGSDISRRYREMSGEDVPPPELDRRVLDEARAAVASGGGGRSRSWLRWSAPLALAASVVLVVTVVIESGVQNDASFATQQVAADKARVEQQRQLAESKLRDEVAQQQPQQERQVRFTPEPPAAMAPQAPAVPPPAAAAAAALAKTESERANSAASEEVRVHAKALLRDQSERATPVTVVNSETIDSPAPQMAAEQPSFAGSVAPVSAHKEAAPAPAEADAAEDLSSVTITGNIRARRTGRTAGPRATMPGSALSSETRPAADEDAERADLRSDPQKWLEQIRELRRAGKAEEADRAWEQFHKAFPNFPVADDDLARKQR
jgi:hypothetical protein